MIYCVYTRVSARGSRWEGETSCDAQAEECRRAVLASDSAATFEIVKEEFQSGTSNARPLLRSILSGMATAKWDVLVTLDMDRLARSQEGWIEISRLLSKHGKGLICVRQNADFSSIQGRMMLGLFAVIGEYFARQSAQKTRDKMQHMARQGLWGPGSTPFGYRRRGKADNVLVPVPDQAATVKAIFARYIAGESTTELARDLDMGEDRITRILKSEVYCGVIRYGEITAKGQHEPIVTRQQFDAAARRLPKTATAPRPAAHSYPYLLAGLIHCSCGSTMTASYAVGGTGRRYPRYRCGNQRCTAATRLIRADLIEEAVLREIAAAADRDEHIEENYRRILAMVTTIRQQTSEPLQRLRAELAPLEKRAANLSSALQAGSFGPETVKALSADLEALHGQIRWHQNQILAHERQLESAVAPETIQQLAAAWRKTAHDLVTSQDHEARQSWIRHHIQDITSQGGDAWHIRFWASSAAVCAKGGEWYPARWLCTLLMKIKRAA